MSIFDYQYLRSNLCSSESLTQSIGGDDKPRSIKVRRRTTQPQELLYGISTSTENQKNEDQNQNQHQNHNHPLTRVPSAPGSLKFVVFLIINLFRLARLSFTNLCSNLFVKPYIFNFICFIASFSFRKAQELQNCKCQNCRENLQELDIHLKEFGRAEQSITVVNFDAIKDDNGVIKR